MIIREAIAHDTAILASLISASNQDVAARFGLTLDNCPKHPSFCTFDWINADLARGARYFLAEDAASPVACVAFEPTGEHVAYLNRLSVLPAHRRGGLGAQLVQYVLALAQSSGLPRVSIGVIGQHMELQRWYSKLGFVTVDTQRLAHLPFSVTYMSCSMLGTKRS